MSAAIQAARTTPLDVPLHFVGESDVLAQTMVRDLRMWEDRGWIDAPLGKLARVLANVLRQRCAVTTFQQAETQDERAEMGKAKIEARACRDIRAVAPSMTTNPVFDLSGARLSVMSQKLAYRGVVLRKGTPTRATTAHNIANIQKSLLTSQGLRVHASDVWRSIRGQDMRKQISDFLWKTMHGAQKCGVYWEKIPGYEQRGICGHCGETESMTHILLDCTAPGQHIIWSRAAALWARKGLPWPQRLRIEDIQGVNLRRWTHARGRRRKGAERLWRILVSESAFLVWKLRCERVIGHEDQDDWHHTERAIVARWVKAINDRLHLDMSLTHRRFGRKAIKTDKVLRTWNGTLIDELALPEDWTKYNRVLVGIDPASLEARDDG
ncbi:uncharacterized protein B0H18DRAFT_882671 [Fomitopsis serialis]|uniref:uncharacterized protein n=1 Tax=Fomitopsis serialis TaxID=139415 RepID=UPI0020073D4C|nr:uncharacterized protein B0H18DRAFT_882671 [Neoantrodia serialis]KAH9918602.1 hypothetical protein B0H18DRAFT_882671 [Neoantrodia serialis]